MGQIARLGDVIDRLSEFDCEDTIYASEPWTEESEAMVTRDPDAGGLPIEVSDAGLKYFLEVSVARDFVEDWLASLDDQPTPPAVCQRVIGYAINDA
jgi:hypothetical protein